MSSRRPIEVPIRPRATTYHIPLLSAILLRHSKMECSTTPLLSCFRYISPCDPYEPFVSSVPPLVSVVLVQFFDFLFLNPDMSTG
jgi:hypothetical protein